MYSFSWGIIGDNERYSSNLHKESKRKEEITWKEVIMKNGELIHQCDFLESILGIEC